MSARCTTGLGAVLAGLLAVASASAEARTLAEIRADGALRICVAGSSALFYRSNAEAFAHFLGVRAEVRELGSFAEQFQDDASLLAGGTCDVYPNDLHILPQREAIMRLVPYYRVRNVVVAHRANRSEIKEVADLAGLVAAVQKGTSYEQWVAEANRGRFSGNPVKLVHAATIESVKLVSEAKVDFTVLGTEGALRWVREDPQRLAIYFPVTEPVAVGWGIARNAPELARELARFFEASRHVDSPLDASWRHYYNVSLMEYQLFEDSFSEGRIDLKSILRWAVPIGVAALAILLAMLFWNRRLNREVDRRRAAEAAAEEATRAKSMFLASMSHEIRTPMNGVLGMLQLMALTRLDAEQKASLDTVRDSARSLLRIIDDVLDFSKIEAGRLELRPEPTSVAALVESVRGVYSGVASAKDLPLSGSVDPRISPALVADALRLRQILNNFASNAIKFTEKGKVEIGAVLEGREAGKDVVRFYVRDTGIGISKEAQAQLFQPYVQAAIDTARRYGGTGLGLIICRRLADLMAGTIRMESEPGKGTTMTLTVALPVADVRDLPKPDNRDEAAATLVASRRRAPTVEAARAEGTLVLIAEDHSTNRIVLTRLLGLLGYATVSAADGREALQKWEAGGFAAIVTDCNMPEMDGYDLARAVRRKEAGGKRIPIIACTANALADEQERCAAAGMDDFVAKPVELEPLAQVMERWLPLPSNESLLDAASLAAVSGGDAAMEREILADFQAASVADMAKLRAAFSGRDLPAIAVTAHRIKGGSLTIGASVLATVCASIEAAAKQNDWARVAAERETLDREFQRLSAWLSLQPGTSKEKIGT